ncbi:MAG TPA: phosphatase PAP2 family protein [Balneolales bacterium]|nr:phosphatase PAP2 family protein [Balneolales bacterium]
MMGESTLNSYTYRELWHKSPSFLLARLFSDVFNPLIIPPVTYILVYWGLNITLHSFIQVLLIVTIFFTVLPFGIVYYFKQKHYIQNFDITERAERIRPFFVIIFSYATGLLTFFIWFHSPDDLPVYIALCYIINAFIGVLITTKWKISVHSASIATFTAIIIYLHNYHFFSHDFSYADILVWSSLLLIPILMWSRIKLNLHTFIQTIAGAIIGFFITFLELSLMIG